MARISKSKSHDIQLVLQNVEPLAMVAKKFYRHYSDWEYLKSRGLIK